VKIKKHAAAKILHRYNSNKHTFAELLLQNVGYQLMTCNNQYMAKWSCKDQFWTFTNYT